MGRSRGSDSSFRDRVKILVSACLAGCNCRYNGQSVEVGEISRLVRRGKALAACPELLGGLDVPRERSEIVGGDGWAVLDGRATVRTISGRDVTAEFIKGARLAVDTAGAAKCRYAILKSNSPSCGVGTIFDGSFSGKMRLGDGVTAAALRGAGLDLRVAAVGVELINREKQF